MNIRKKVGMVHLWLGLTSGLVVFIIAITGCIYAFQTEIQSALQSYRFFDESTGVMLPPSRLAKIAEEQLSGKHLHAVLYNGTDEAAQAIFYNFDPEYYYIIYLNPYTGEVLKVKDMEIDFFHIVLDGHFYLWLPPTIGQPVVATATLIFTIMLISGIILWWPKQKKDLKQRFTVKWKARWRRVNYDLHNVPGFYACAIALIFALTGLVWGFQWFANGVYKIAGGEKSLVYRDPVSDTTKTSQSKIPAIDLVFDKMTALYPNAAAVEVHVPDSKSAVIAANANTDVGTYWKLDYRYFDQYTLEELPVEHIYGRITEADVADKLLRMNYDIHTGAIFGLPGKILAFFASLICASLPVTGFCIWLGRRKKVKATDKRVAVVV